MIKFTSRLTTAPAVIAAKHAVTASCEARARIEEPIALKALAIIGQLITEATKRGERTVSLRVDTFEVKNTPWELVAHELRALGYRVDEVPVEEDVDETLHAITVTW